MTKQNELDRNFEQMMKGATLVGHSTQTDRDQIGGEERYVINSATKLTGETWMLSTRIHLGGREFPVPVPVTIKWAGDTPVITLTDLSIPGLGTYTARVLLYGDQYAGTWSSGHEGGQVFGKIVHNPQ